jgi:AraC-like DNA-binding protein
MKPQFERVTFPRGCSLRVYDRRVPQIPFEWHHHPEYELTLTLNSRGWRFIGDHIGQYDGPDLVLVPPDMPHTWASTGSHEAGSLHTAIVVWFDRRWAFEIATLCPEYAGIRRLLNQAVGGLAFAAEATTIVITRLDDLRSDRPSVRLHAALEILNELGAAPAMSLSKSGGVIAAGDGEVVQLTRALDHLHAHFDQPIRIARLCALAHTSERSLHRLFVRHTGESVGGYLSRLRIGRACMRLAETDLPISLIAQEVGLSNMANFNRQFRRLRSMTPKQYRESFRRNGALPDAPGREDLSQRPPSLEKARRQRVVVLHEASPPAPLHEGRSRSAGRMR